uniref:Uncharacterized protein LOC105628433 n=1 Tax=Rhizophora mucronata TaxID=61149 RepID=A0A2P2IHG2_RHIMU
MGLSLSASKRVKTTLSDSPEFGTACDSAFGHCLSLTEHAFRGVLPYQLSTASDQIHATLLRNRHPVIIRWVPSPPTRTQVDSALRVVTRRRPKEKKAAEEEEILLGPAKFKEWAVVLFAEAAVGNAGKAVLARVPIGVAGIVGIGAATRTGRNLVGAAVGVYALGVATSVYFGLSG